MNNNNTVFYDTKNWRMRVSLCYMPNCWYGMSHGQWGSGNDDFAVCSHTVALCFVS